MSSPLSLPVQLLLFEPPPPCDLAPPLEEQDLPGQLFLFWNESRTA